MTQPKEHASRIITAFLLGSMLWLPLSADAGQDSDRARTYPLQRREPQSTVSTELVAGFASLLVTPVYGACKLTFASLGAVSGGLAWAFSGGDKELAGKIWQRTMGGTYVITPDHLAGREPVRFIGDS